LYKQAVSPTDLAPLSRRLLAGLKAGAPPVALLLAVFAASFASFAPAVPAGLLALLVVLVLVFLGRGLLLLFPHSRGVFGEWLLPLALGMGAFQLVWFAACWLRLPPLLLAALLAAVSNQAFAGRRPPAELAEPRRPWLQLGAAVLACAAVTYFPFRNFGEFFAGAFHYRASFWAVTLKHFAVVNNLAAPFPFDTFYFFGEPLHYYYLSYSFPALLKSLGASSRDAVFLFHGLQGLVFILASFYLFFQLTKKGGLAWLFNAILLFSVSFEGIWFILKRWPRFIRDPLFFRSLVHFDGVSNLFVAGPQIDAVHRAVLFTPMHLQALSFFVLLLVALRAKRTGLAGVLCLFSFLSSFFLGAVAFAFTGIHLAVRLIGREKWKGYLAQLALCGGFALLLVRLSGMVRPLSYRVSWENLSWSIVPVALLNFGPYVVLGAVGLVAGRRREGNSLNLALLAFLALLFLLCFYVKVEPLGDEVAIKLALVLQVVLLFGTALLRPAKALVAALAVLFLLGLPTAVGDVYCAQDNSSRPHTLRVPAEEMALARWIAANLPADAVVQASPRRREWFFSIVPVFAERPTFLGDRMHLETFLVDPASGRDRLAALASALDRVNEPQGRGWLSASPIEYLFYGRREAQEFPEPREMETVARFGGAKLFRVPKGGGR
jgi:hypothetical protein